MNDFPKNDLFELNEDGYLLWKNSANIFVSFNLMMTLNITKNDIINGLKDFINAGGIIRIKLDRHAKLILVLSLPSYNANNSIYLTEVPIEFYNSLNLNDIVIDRTMLYDEIQYSKQILKVYESFSDEEKLKIEIGE